MTAPTPMDVARFASGQSPDEEAMRLYLAWPGGQVGRRLLQSLYVLALSHVFKAAAGGADFLRSAVGDVDRLTVALWHSADPIGARSTSKTARDVLQPQLFLARLERLQARTTTLQFAHSGGHVAASLGGGAVDLRAEMTGAHSALIRARGGAEWTGARLFVEVLGDASAPTQFEQVFHDVPHEEASTSEVVVVSSDSSFRLEHATIVVTILD